MWKIEILRKHSHISAILYRVYDNDDVEDAKVMGSIVIEENEIESWKKTIAYLNSLLQ